MQYKIYTMPHCDKCQAIKGFLKEKNIIFDEINLGDDDGVADLRKIYPKLKDKVARTADGQLPIPLFVALEGADIKSVAHKLEEVKNLF